ncbi:MAG TPA: LapA family protein [Casimicrobiaceae bacterium]|jgi:lipopolysaccharide assembly protein A|nr:LapA family protein [Casimicrobiaceae bacterium]
MEKPMSVLRWVLGALLFVALLFLALQNTEPVTLKFYQWWSWQAPLIFMLLIAFAIGVAAGLLAGALRSARLKRQLNRLRRRQDRRDVIPGPHGAAPGTAPASGPGFERAPPPDAP